jgi:hypothetical protein
MTEQTAKPCVICRASDIKIVHDITIGEYTRVYARCVCGERGPSILVKFPSKRKGTKNVAEVVSATNAKAIYNWNFVN